MTKMKFTKQDIETIDFIHNQLTMNENCDSFGLTDFEEKHILFDRAKDLMFRLSEIVIKNQRK